jgi:hypothetical protein
MWIKNPRTWQEWWNCWLFLFLLLPVFVHAQERELSVSLHSISDSVVALPDNFPDFSTLRIQVDSSFLLRVISRDNSPQFRDNLG